MSVLNKSEFEELHKLLRESELKDLHELFKENLLPEKAYRQTVREVKKEEKKIRKKVLSLDRMDNNLNTIAKALGNKRNTKEKRMTSKETWVFIATQLENRRLDLTHTRFQEAYRYLKHLTSLKLNRNKHPVEIKGCIRWMATDGKAILEEDTAIRVRREVLRCEAANTLLSIS